MNNYIYKCMDPRGDSPDIELIPPVKRLDDLHNKTIYFIDILKRNSDVLTKNMIALFKKQYPQSNFIYYPKTCAYNKPESNAWWNEIMEKAEAAVVSVGD
ncbi:MAG TPA: hypothetical protein GX699_10900 [Firmicutes bacterium]|nr:hypothetical protein [Bacillota bacterium]